MPSSTPATQEYQRAQVALRALTYKDIPQLWALLDLEDLDATFTMFSAAVLQVIRQRREVSATLARRYLADMRAGVDTPPPEIASAPLAVADALVALRYASVVSIKVAMIHRRPIELASRNALVRTMGVTDRLIGDAGRELIRASVEADPAARGWIRVTLGTCDFCQKQAAGDHMKSGDASFPRHDHCGCQPEPVYDAHLQPEEVYVQKIMDMLEGDKTGGVEKQLRAIIANPETKPLSRLNAQTALERRAQSKVANEAAAAAKARQAATRQSQVLKSRTPGSIADRVAVPQDALDALFPKGGWTTSTRAKTVGVLKQSPQGRQLLKTMDSFQSGGSTAIPRLRTDIEKYLAGGDLPEGRKDAIETFLSAVGRSDAGERPLWRGMSIPGDMENVAARYKAGDDLDLSLASFSSDKKLAQDFTQQGAGQKVRAATKTPVLVEWVGSGKRALPIERLSKSRVFSNEKEWVGAGRYVIEGTRRVRRNGVETLIVTIRQKGVW